MVTTRKEQLLGQDEDEEYLYKCDEFEIQKKNRYYDVVPSEFYSGVEDRMKDQRLNVWTLW